MTVQLDVAQPVLLGPDEGEPITEEASRRITIKVAHDLLVLTESHYGPGEVGPDLHVHRQHTDAFYVLEGELTFELGLEREQRTAAAGALVVVPANVIHGFRNDAPHAARFLNVHAPNGGFAESLRARRDQRPPDEEFDSFDPPAEGGRTIADVVVVGPAEGDTRELRGAGLVFKAGAETGDGTLSLWQTTAPPGFSGPPPHYHERHVDVFYVLEGTLTLALGDAGLDLSPGSCAGIPPATVHTFANTGDEPVRFLNFMAPGGFEALLKQLAIGEQPQPGEYDFHPV